MRVIINADDLGISDEVNTTIEQFINKGVISSSTILANGKSFDSVSGIVRRHPDISFGAHLNLSEFESMTKSPVFSKYGLTNSDGFFVQGAIHRVCFTKELKEAISNEWRVQITTILKAGISISHIDGHHHCHTQPELYHVLKTLANEFNIRKIRQNGVKPFYLMRRRSVVQNVESKSVDSEGSQSQAHSSFMAKMKMIVHGRIWYYRTKYDFTTTDLFLSYDLFTRKLEAIRNKKNSTVELMCHPGHPKFKAESELLLLNAQKSEKIATLISYLEL